MDATPRGGRSVCVLALAALSACASVKPTPPQTTFQDRVDAEVRKVLEESKAPSASVAVIRNGEVIYARAVGQARLDPVVALQRH